MTEMDTTKEAKESLGKVLSEDALMMADYYAQLEFLLRDKKISPTSAELEAMAVTLYLERKRARAQERRESPSEAVNEEKEDQSEEPKSAVKPRSIRCPECARVVEPSFSGRKRVWYYRCPECDLFINKDGSTSVPRQ